MNDPKLILDKLETLVDLSRSAKTEIEKAALFGAISNIIRELDDEDAEHHLALGESIERIRWSSSAILGYDITNGHGNDQHFSWFLGSLDEVRKKFAK